MTTVPESVRDDRASLVLKSLARHRLVFLQIGVAFEPIRSEILTALDGVAATVEQRHEWSDLLGNSSILVVSDLDFCVDSSENLLGEVREIVMSLLDAGKMICLASRAPRISYRSVPGSSVLEDAAFVSLPLLSKSEIPLEEGARLTAGWPWPLVAFGSPLDVNTYASALHEMGQGLISALDHALFELNPKGAEGLQFLSARELEGLRGSGLIHIDSTAKPTLAMPQSSKMLREALAAHVSETVVPASILPEVTSGLWYIERRIRAALRVAAIAKFGTSWRSDCLGGLKAEVLKRAQLDTNVAAKTVADLRDPLEWLTLSELMDIVRGPKFENLGVEAAIWRKLQEQLVPIRNRLAHVRMLKSEDAEIVSMWAHLVRSRFDV